MLLHELEDINYALGHGTNKMFTEWYELQQAYSADPTEENKLKVENAKYDYNIMQKAFKLFNKIKWKPEEK